MKLVGHPDVTLSHADALALVDLLSVASYEASSEQKRAVSFLENSTSACGEYQRCAECGALHKLNTVAGAQFILVCCGSGSL